VCVVRYPRKPRGALRIADETAVAVAILVAVAASLSNISVVSYSRQSVPFLGALDIYLGFNYFGVG